VKSAVEKKTDRAQAGGVQTGGANEALVSLDPKQKLFQGFLPMLSIKLQGRAGGRAIQ
jgi:hypothetical protein